MFRFSLRAKLLVAFLTINLISIVGVAIIYNRATTTALKEGAGTNLKSLADSKALVTGDLLARRLDALLSLSTNPVLCERAVSASRDYDGDHEAITARLLELNEQWLTASDDDLLVQRILKNASATEIHNFQGFFPGFAEVLLTDRYGELIAASNRTTDYYQADEGWWQTAYNDGRGAFYLSQPLFDESGVIMGIDIAVPIMTERSHTVDGVIKATYRLTSLADLLADSSSQSSGLHMYILLADDRLFVPDDDVLTTIAPETLTQLRALADQRYVELTLFGEAGMVSQSPVHAITGEQVITDLGWYVVMYQDRQKALAPVEEQQRFIVMLSMTTLIGAALAVLWFAQSISRPILRLTTTAQQVRQGNHHIRASVDTTDEIGQLAQAFNDMTSQLRHSIDTLEREIIEHKRTEEELTHYRNRLKDLVEQRTIELQAANEQLIVLGKIKDEFVSNVSHELRTPITSLKLHQYLLQKSPGQIDKHLPIMKRETDRLAQIIEDLLQLSRLEQGSTANSWEPVDLNVMVGQYVADRMFIARNKKLLLKFQEGPKLPFAMADEGLLGQVLSILLTNAINYTPAGGQVTVRTHFDQDRNKQWVGFSVSDTGKGISSEEQPRLFSRFFRGQIGLETGVPGTGLGLSIAKKIVTQHGGRIEVESDGIQGHGARFSVWLPVIEE